VFDDLWQAVSDNYLYNDFNGLDWDSIRLEYSQIIQKGLTDEDFYAAMAEMISRLNDDHSVFLDPEAAARENADFAGENNFVGIGILTTAIPERDRIAIILTFPDSPAERAGLRPHDSILAADGVPVLDENGTRRDLLRGPAGTQVTLTVQSPGEEPRQVKLIRNRVNGPLPVFYTRLETPQGRKIGYILLTTFADETTDDQVAEAIQQLSQDAPLDGLVLDNRFNSGGADNVARGVLSFFTNGVLGYFVDREQIERPFQVIATDLHASSKLPLVVLVGRDTVSFGEIFSGVLRDSKRAYLIGEPTEGNIELLWGYDFEDGSRAWIAQEAFRPTNHPDQDWEVEGIVPDEIVVSHWDEVTLETDPVIQAALNYLDTRQ
jgi:C-terminal peptidase prc